MTSNPSEPLTAIPVPPAAEAVLLAIPVGLEDATPFRSSPEPSLALPANECGRRLRMTPQNVAPWTVSALVHLAAVVALGLWVVPIILSKPATVLTATVDREPVPPASLAAAVSRIIPQRDRSQTTSAAERAVVPTFESTVAPVAASKRADVPQIERPSGTMRGGSPQYASVGELTREVPAASSPTPSKKPQRERTSPTTGVVAAADVNAAVDGVLSMIRKEYDAGDLMVVWLLDASLSLLDDRQMVAARLDPFYREIAERQGKPHVLMSAAVAYGANVLEIQAPTRYGVRLTKATSQDVPIDETGIENVMQAVDFCVQKYRKSWHENLLIVVWTDESGDDILRLEETIAYCRKQNVMVSVVGPTAIFGSERGFHPYTDAGTGYRFLLPVKCGPDTSLPERIPLPYWHDSLIAPWSRDGVQVDTGTATFGGAYREGLLSGIGPYALTRLSLETGGKFTLLHTEGEVIPFAFEKQRNYLPDYGSAADYLRQLGYNPLRRAVSEVVQLAYAEHEKLLVPKLSFVSDRDDEYPFAVHNPYVTPGEFRLNLIDEFDDEVDLVAAGSQVLEVAISRFGPQGMEKEYEREKSARWRAWYDLTYGRLLAASVRHVEYVRTCRFVLDNSAALSPETNHLIFVPSSQLRSTESALRKRAAEAERLLRRCIEKNPDTPWALLAKWELDRPLGLDVRQSVIPMPPPAAGVPAPAAPLPALPKF